MLGAGLGWLTLLQLPLLLLANAPNWAGLVAWLLGAGALGTLAWGIGSGWSVPGAETRADANLIATRQQPIRCWIVAHLDSKAQAQSMAGRLVAIWATLLAATTLTALSGWRLITGQPLPLGIVAAAGVLGMGAGYLAGRGKLFGESPGARDNASGVVAALVAAAEIRDPAIGVVVTGAEEFGLIGARMFLQAGGQGHESVAIINLDTLAETGSLYVVTHATGATQLADHIATALQPIGVPVVRRRLPLGILVDSLPFARRGVPAATVSRLDWQTLRLMHTPRDAADGTDLGFIEEVARAVSTVAESIVHRSRSDGTAQ